MSHEIIAQPGLTKIECDVILTALEWFREAITTPHPGGDNPAQALKKEQFMEVAAGIEGKIARNVVAMGKMKDARLITPGSGRRPRPV